MNDLHRDLDLENRHTSEYRHHRHLLHQNEPHLATNQILVGPAYSELNHGLDKSLPNFAEDKTTLLSQYS